MHYQMSLLLHSSCSPLFQLQICSLCPHSPLAFLLSLSLTRFFLGFLSSPWEPRRLYLSAPPPFLLAACSPSSPSSPCFSKPQGFCFLFFLLPASPSLELWSSPSTSFLRTWAVFSYISTSPLPSTARCILFSLRYSSCFFFCLLLQGYLWWRCYSTFLLYVLI